MLKNYLRAALRGMAKNRMYTFVNILGLTIGLWACMIVATVVIDDLSYDKQWSRANDLYRIVSVNKMGEGLYDRSSSSFKGLQGELKKNFPEVEAVAGLRVSDLRLRFNGDLSNGVSVQALGTDTSIWKMLDISVLEGNPRIYVNGHPNLLISEDFRHRFFKGVDPVGRMVYSVPDYGEADSFLITGIIKNLPANTHLRADVIKVENHTPEPLSHAGDGTSVQQYLLLSPGSDIRKFTGKVNKWYRDFMGSKIRYQFEFQSVKDVYLHSDFAEDQSVKGSARNIYIFSGTALLLLLIACINFINLTTARSITRLKEMGVRKILGAGRIHIIRQMLAETLLFFCISALLSICLYQLSLQLVERFLGHSLMETFVSRLPMLASACGMILLVSLFTGIYPAWLMAGFNPAGSLSGRLASSGASGQGWLRKSLVVVQFSISIVVLLAMIVVQQQVRFMDNKDLGFDKKGLLSIGRISWQGKGDVFKNELLKFPGVEQASISAWLPADGAGFMSSEFDDPDHPGGKIKVWYIAGDPDLARTLGLRLRSGRLLNPENRTDAVEDSSFSPYSPPGTRRQASLITATTARLLHVSKLNMSIKNDFTNPVGIIEDVNNESLRQMTGPTFIIAMHSMNNGGMLVRVRPGSEKQVMIALQALWRKFYPGRSLEMKWVEETLSRQYETESKLQQLFVFFSTLTMLLAALGVFGLILHAVGQRVKEIGVRKVLGASVTSIVHLLTSDFIRLVLIAIVIASPLAWWIMNKWLEDFAYRTPISWWMFAVAGVSALVITFATVSYQAFKSALANPVHALRSE